MSDYIPKQFKAASNATDNSGGCNCDYYGNHNCPAHNPEHPVHVKRERDALRDAEEQRDQALAQVAAAVEALTFWLKSTKPTETKAIGKAKDAVYRLQPTAQAHAERLRQEGREEERARAKYYIDRAIADIIPLQGTAAVSSAIGELNRYCLAQQPTDAAEGGQDA